MIFSWSLLITLLSLSTTGVESTTTPSKRTYDTHHYYALEYYPGLSFGASLDEVATTLGVEVVERVGAFRDTWLVRAEKQQLDKREEEESVDLVMSTFERLQVQASSHISSRSEDSLLAKRVVSSITFLERQILQELVKRAPPSITPPHSATAQEVADRLHLMDPLFKEQWHLVNDEHPENMMNVTPVWDMGITGKGVLVSYIDDGLDNETDDLKDAFDAENSYDFNTHVKLPKPTGQRDHHGTRCAGQVAARRNKSCGVGIAYDSTAAGIRILGGRITTVDEAAALNYGYQKAGIYSCSWGPRDNGKTMNAPSYLVRKAFSEGINNGREGKGSIFVFASGNGGRNEDECNFDGYTNSIYSVTVGAVDHEGLHPTYSEGCAANMIVAYSSGSGKHIITTDRGKDLCSHTHGGTSAAAPNAVGVFALALQARPDLTWRDIQHLCIETARRINPEDSDWERTTSGRFFSYKYGYGVLDAFAYVNAAKTWKLVKPQAWIITNTTQLGGGRMLKKHEYEGGEPIGPQGNKNTIEITKEMMLDNNLETLEHIDVRVWINHTRRGDVEVQLVSPNGITSVLCNSRAYDDSKTGFPGWRFMTIKHWGENPIGKWTIKVSDQDNDEKGLFLGWNMALWGSAVDASKAEKYWQPVVDDALPPSDVPPRPELGDADSTASTIHSKPTDHLPPDHGSAMSPKPSSDSDTPSDAWYSHVATLVSAQKWFFAGLGAASVFLIAALVYFWRRRVARKRLAEYTSLAANDIHMDAVGQTRVPGTGRPRTDRVYDEDEFEEASTEELAARSEPVIVPSAPVGLGFHSSFLDDDEPSAALSPKYRDEPESPNPRGMRSSKGRESPSVGGEE